MQCSAQTSLFHCVQQLHRESTVLLYSLQPRSVTASFGMSVRYGVLNKARMSTLALLCLLMKGKLVITDLCKHYSYDQWKYTDSSRTYPVLSHKITEAWQAFYKDSAKQLNCESTLEHGKGECDCFPTYFTFNCTERSQVYHFWKLDMPVNLP